LDLALKDPPSLRSPRGSRYAAENDGDSAMRMRTGVLGWLAVLLASAVVAAPVSVPPPLQPWQDWVRHGHEHRDCPLLQGQPAGPVDSHACAWPGPLSLEVDAAGARFSLDWLLLQAGQVPLPGDPRQRPLSVTVGGREQPVLLRDGQPTLRLAAGRHRIEGRFEWSRRPERLAVPEAIGIVTLQVDGVAVALPERDGAQLWLGRSAEVAVGADSLSLRVYRRLDDGVPLRLSTDLQLDVSGRAREALLGRVLPAGFVPVAIDSPLPAAIGPDGSLRVQLRPGSWRLRLEARGLALDSSFAAPANPPPWPEEEIWSYRAAPALRSTEPVGARPVDPQQVGVPWGESLPSFVLDADATLAIEQRSRGLDPDRPHRLSLARELWLDFDGGAATARDRISGRLAQAGRLDLGPPWQLARAQAAGRDLLVTHGAMPETSGIELRALQVELDTLARRASLAGGAAAGWQQDFESMRMTLHLPPGWLLLHAGGADSAETAWIARWTLLDLFLLALAALLAYRLLGVGFGLLVLGYLLLGYHQPGAPLWTLILLLLVSLLFGLLPQARLARWTAATRMLLLLLLIGWTLPFAAGQLKLALYPQLERHAVGSAGEAQYGEHETYAVAMTISEASQRAPEAMPAPPPAPRAVALDRVQVSGARMKQDEPAAPPPARLDRYPSDAIVQAGPGIPDWGWRAARIDWQGPVLQDQPLALWLSPPWLTRCLRLLLVGLLGVVLLRLARSLRAAATSPAATPSAAPLAGLLALALLAPAAEATEFPSPELLEQLRERLLKPADCAPDCAALAGAELQIDGDRLRLALDLRAEAAIAAPLPEIARGAALRALRLDSVGVPLLRRHDRQWLALPRGVHRVELDWQLGPADSIELRFPLPPVRLSAQASGWELAGLQDGRLLGDTLQLLRRARSASGEIDDAAVQEFPPFVRISRTLLFDLDWSVHTEVQRIAPQQAGFSLRLPLLAGERVLGDQHEVADGQIEVAFAAGQERVGWRSQLPITEQLALTAAPLDRVAEHWQLRAGPLWQLAFDGVAEADLADAGGQRSFRPLPGETLALQVSRPAALPGASVAIDRGRLHWTPGQRAADALLQLDIRSTRGGPHVLALPAQAELISVSLGGRPLSLRLAEDGRLTLPLQPGSQALELRWRQPEAMAMLLRSPAVGLGAEAANLRIETELGAERWLLATAGGGIGPALLYWPQLALMLLVAFGLARLGGTPLRFHQWVLLGLGFSTVSWLAGAVVAGWLLALGWRGRAAEQLAAGGRWRHALVQLGLLLASGLALGALVLALNDGLLGRPDMQLTGNGSEADPYYGIALLYWFFDRAAALLPQVSLLSLPLWVYKLAILAWALWLANALIRWLRWGWQAYAAGGYWPAPRAPAKAPE
jgi:hypothetical protein